MRAGLQFFLEWAVLHFIDEEKRARAELYVGAEVGGDGQCGRDSEQYNCGSQSIDGVADHGNLLLAFFPCCYRFVKVAMFPDQE